jgi:hypothetical protein
MRRLWRWRRRGTLTQFVSAFETYEFAALARYNAERARGLVHTPEWVEKMAFEQRRFDAQRSVLEPGDPGPPEHSKWGL